MEKARSYPLFNRLPLIPLPSMRHAGAVLFNAVFALAYFLSAQWNLLYGIQQSHVAALWIPSGLVFGAFLVWGLRLWPGALTGAYAAYLAFFLSSQEIGFLPAVYYSSWFAFSSLAEGVLGVYILRRLFGQRNPFGTLHDLFRFFIAVMGVSLVSVTVESLVDAFMGTLPVHELLVVWLIAWFSHWIAISSIVPLFFSFREHFFMRGKFLQLSEFVIFIFLTVALNFFVFGGHLPLSYLHYPVTYLFLSLVLWAAMRFNHFCVPTTILIIALFSMWGTDNGHGPFAQLALYKSELFLQSFYATCCLLGLILIAALNERLQSEDTLKEMNIALSNAMPGISRLDQNGFYEYMNDLYAGELGYQPREMVGRNWEITVHPDFRKRAVEAYQVMVRDGKGEFEAAGVRKNGSIFFKQVLMVKRVDKSGKFIGHHCFMKNITERKQAETILKSENKDLETLVIKRSEELFKVQNELKQANRLSSIGTLAATVAHELRNPLGVIRMATYNIRNKVDNPATNRHFAHIEKKIYESDLIINNLLSYSNIKLPHYQKVSVHNLLTDCVQLVGTKYAHKRIRVTKDIEPVRGECIEADEFQIREVIVNILDNAYQSIEHDHGRIRMKARVQDFYMKIKVQDNGIGIDKNEKADVFKPFFTNKSKGTGLGLAICHELVQLHNGKIELVSRKLHGTAMTISLPMRRSHDGAQSPYN